MPGPDITPLHVTALQMLPDDLAAAVVDARTRLSDDTVIVRIEAYDDRPGFTTVARDGADLQAGLTQDQAIEYLEKLV